MVAQTSVNAGGNRMFSVHILNQSDKHLLTDWMRDVREGINDDFKILGPKIGRTELPSRLKPKKKKKKF